MADRHNLDGNAIAADLHYGRADERFCSHCGRPIDGDSDLDGSRWDRHHRFADLCEICGDDMEDER